jgi:hypothetical protein
MIPLGTDDFWMSSTRFAGGCLYFEQMRNDLGAGSTSNFFLFLLKVMIAIMVMLVIDIYIFKGLHGGSGGSGEGRNGTDGALSTTFATTRCTRMDIERNILGRF